MTKPTKVTAVQKLERSQLSPHTVQRELMGDDLDLESMLVYLKSKIKFDAIDRVIDVNVERTIEGASTVEVVLNDGDRAILRSGLLNNRLDIEMDGLWFRLVKVAKQDDHLTLTFEDREVAILRTYNKLKIAKRENATRAEFVVNLLREVKEFKIPYVIPELHKVQPIQKSADVQIDWDGILNKGKGIPADNDAAPSGSLDQVLARGAGKKALTVKNVTADPAQINNANIIMRVGESMGAVRKVVVSAIMTAITESSLRNLPYGDRDSVGLFQQRDSWGSQEDRMDPATSAKLYYTQAIKIYNSDPNISYGDLCQRVQVSAYPDRYATHRTEAERFVTAYGITGADRETAANVANNQGTDTTQSSTYIFYRGIPDSTKKTWKKEDSWTCIQRLADDVHWRAFFISGVFYYISEDDLIKSLPIATVTESSSGIEGIDGDYDQGKKTATLTVTARVGTWLVPPGAIILIQDMGPWNGRWIVSTFARSLFDSKATIVLKKPMPRLPEPALNDVNTLQPGWADNSVDPGGPAVYGRSAGLVHPLPTPLPKTSSFNMPDGCEGVPNAPSGQLCARDGTYHVHGAVDWFAAGGTRVVAPAAGEIVEIKLSSGNSGQVFGGVVKVRDGNGNIWVFRHVNPRAPLAVGGIVSQGQGIADVTTWADNPSSSHCHIEVWKTLEGGYTYDNMIDPLTLFGNP